MLKLQQVSPIRNETYVNHIKELQKELQMETQRRIEAERRVFLGGLDDGDINEDDGLSFANITPLEACAHHQHAGTSDDHVSVENLIQRANRLLGMHNPQHRGPHQKLLTYEHPTTANELMREFQSLLEAFYIEQRQNDASKDVIWLFEELEWRFEEIKRSYEEERFTWECKATKVDASTGEERQDGNMNEWRACLEELVETVKTQSVDGATMRRTISSLQNEDTTNLHMRHQLSSINLMQKQKCRNMNQEIETIKQSYQEKMDEMSKTIEMQQMTIEEHCNKITQLQQDTEIRNSRYLQEKHSHHINEESMAARIRYLEEIVRSSNNFKSPTYKSKCTAQLMIPQSNESSGSDDEALEYAHVQRCRTPQLDERKSNYIASVSVVESENDKMTAPHETDSSAMILSLQQQIEELGAALQKSEEQRAKAIDGFQVEREGHIRQFEELSEYVRQILDSDNANINGDQLA